MSTFLLHRNVTISYSINTEMLIILHTESFGWLTDQGELEKGEIVNIKFSYYLCKYDLMG